MDLASSMLANQVQVQTVVAKLTVETLDEGILRGLPGLNELQLHTPALRPEEHCLAGEFGTVVANQRVRQRATQPVQPQANRSPEIEKSPIWSTHSRAWSSTTLRIRKRRPFAGWSEKKSMDHRALAASGTDIRIRGRDSFLRRLVRTWRFPRGKCGRSACGSGHGHRLRASHAASDSRTEGTARQAFSDAHADRDHRAL